jgi:stringent starvation protein B
MPFIVKGYYDWFLDNDFPVNVRVYVKDTIAIVPESMIDENGTITLNMTPNLIWDFKLEEGIFSYMTNVDNADTYVSFPAELILGMSIVGNDKEMNFDEYVVDIEQYKIKNQPTEPVKKASHLKLM